MIIKTKLKGVAFEKFPENTPSAKEELVNA
jgi:hypothetical protein